MKGVKIPDETRKTIYDRIAAGDKISDIAAGTGVDASTPDLEKQLLGGERIAEWKEDTGSDEE